MGEPAPSRPQIKEISPELNSKMLKAGDLAELMDCWKQLAEELSFGDSIVLDDENGKLLKCLTNITVLVKREGCACENYVKEIFSDPEVIEELSRTNIPREFLLHTVRITALHDQLNSMSGNNRHNPVDNFTDVNGYSWANDKLADVKSEKAEAASAHKEIQAAREKAQKDAAIQAVAAEMNDPEFNMSVEHRELLKDSFEDKLMASKAFLERYASKSPLKEFISDHSQDDITPELYRDFVAAARKVRRVNRDYFDEGSRKDWPLDVMNPESGWFYVAIKNKKTKLGVFINACYSNFNSWFKL